MRSWRTPLPRWRCLLASALALYAFLFLPQILRDMTRKQGIVPFTVRPVRDLPLRMKEKPVKEESDDASVQKLVSWKGDTLYIEDVLTSIKIPLRQRLTAQVKPGEKRLILSWNAGHSAANLGGCPDWNCEFTNDRSRVKDADAVLLMNEDGSFHRRDEDQYTVYFSQESPKNSGYSVKSADFFNMSLGFRHDTPASSPYGYTVRLAPQSQRQAPFIDEKRAKGKTKAAAWFVSHCGTNSRRENLVKDLQRFIGVDVYGNCGPLNCPRGSDKCEKMLDEDYHFYLAFENSICKDYMTEKLWDSAYGHDIVPMVLKRSLIESFVPPGSFIAVDDFETTRDLAAHMQFLMDNKTAYMEYFNWRRDHQVVFLDGSHHDEMERPWGFCQVCRLAWTKPREPHVIHDFHEYWTASCEKDGELVDPIIARSQHLTALRNGSNEELSARERIHAFNERVKGV